MRVLTGARVGAHRVLAACVSNLGLKLVALLLALIAHVWVLHPELLQSVAPAPAPCPPGLGP